MVAIATFECTHPDTNIFRSVLSNRNTLASTPQRILWRNLAANANFPLIIPETIIIGMNWDEQSVHLGTNISPLSYERTEPEDKYNHILIILITLACPKKKSWIMIIWVRPTGVSTKYISTNYTVDRHIVDLLLPLISVQWFMDCPWACKCSNSAADDHGIKTP